MRSGATQSRHDVPKVTAVVGGDTYISTDRLIQVYADEQPFGGAYEVLLDNANGALNAKSYAGKPIILTFEFDGIVGSSLAPLWVKSQGFDSIEGKLLMKLICVDVWYLLNELTSAFGAELWNSEAQAPGGPDADATHYDKTIKDILTSILADAGSWTLDFDDDDTFFNSFKPVVNVSNIRETIIQLLNLTKSYLRWEGDSDLHVIHPSATGVVYTFDRATNVYWVNLSEAGMTSPNKIIVYGTTPTPGIWVKDTVYALNTVIIPTTRQDTFRLRCTTAGTSGSSEPTWDTTIGNTTNDNTAVWTTVAPLADLQGSATDSTMVSNMGVTTIQHLNWRNTEVQMLTTQAEVDNYAAVRLDKIQQDRNQGVFSAPMHCSLELFDQVTVDDNRYSGTKSTTGFVHRLVREYQANTGIYRITVFLGGAFTKSGKDAIGLGEGNPLIDDLEVSVPPGTGGSSHLSGVGGSGGVEVIAPWITLFDGATDTPSTIQWAFAAGLPFVPGGAVYFSPIIEEIDGNSIVYLFDQEALNLWKYSVTARSYTKLTSPEGWNGFTGYKTLALNPLGTILAVIGDDATSIRVLGFYDIGTDSWTYSDTAPDIAGTSADVRSLVWADDNILWVWVKKGTGGTALQKCMRYVKSTDTWTQFANDTGALTTSQARSAAIKNDNSVVYGNHMGADAARYYTYTIGTDTYAQSASVGANRNGMWVYNRTTLWNFRTNSDALDYVDTADNSVNNDNFATITDRVGNVPAFAGITSDLVTIIGNVRSTPPPVMKVSGGEYEIGTIFVANRVQVVVWKPEDNFILSIVNVIDGITHSSDHSGIFYLSQGTWQIFYPTSGSFATLEIIYRDD